MSSKANTIINVDTIAELVNFVNSQPIMFCAENGKLYGWKSNLPALLDSSSNIFARNTWNSQIGVSSDSNNVLTKSASDGWGNCGAVSFEKITDIGTVRYIPTFTSGTRIIGLKYGITNQNYNTIDFALLFGNSGVGYVYGNGTQTTSFGYNPVDLDTFDIKIIRDENNVRRAQFYKNNAVFSTIAGGIANGDLYIAIALENQNDKIGTALIKQG